MQNGGDRPRHHRNRRRCLLRYVNRWAGSLPPTLGAARRHAWRLSSGRQQKKTKFGVEGKQPRRPNLLAVRGLQGATSAIALARARLLLPSLGAILESA